MRISELFDNEHEVALRRFAPMLQALARGEIVMGPTYLRSATGASDPADLTELRRTVADPDEAAAYLAFGSATLKAFLQVSAHTGYAEEPFNCHGDYSTPYVPYNTRLVMPGGQVSSYRYAVQMDLNMRGGTMADLRPDVIDKLTGKEQFLIGEPWVADFAITERDDYGRDAAHQTYTSLRNWGAQQPHLAHVTGRHILDMYAIADRVMCLAERTA